MKFFHLFTFMLRRANSLLPQENEKMEFSQPECDTEDWVPGAFKLDYLQPVKLILSPNLSIILIFILGSPIPYYPREWKWEKGIHPKMDEPQGFLYLGHSNWTICSLLSWFCSLNFPTSSSSYWGAHFLLPQRGENEKKGITQKWMRHRGFCTWGIQTGPFAAC